ATEHASRVSCKQRWQRQFFASPLLGPVACSFTDPFGQREERLMPPATTNHAGETEVSILARILAKEDGGLPPHLARYLHTVGFDEHDKARMHDLAMRNQDDALSPAEKEELFAYVKAGNLLSILKSGARRAFKGKPITRTKS